VRANCQILRALVYAVIWNNAQEYTNPIMGLAKTLTDHLTHYQGFNNEVADVCLALVESLQVDFNRTMLNRVVSKFEKITENKLEKLSDKAKEQVRLTWSILSQLNDEGLVTVAPSLRDFCANLKITIYYDAQDAAFEQIKQTLFARYDLGLRVYPVGENDRHVEV